MVILVLATFTLWRKFCKQDTYSWREQEITYCLHIEHIVRANEFLRLWLVNVVINMLIMSLCWPFNLRLERTGLCCSLEWTSVQCQSMLNIVVLLFQFPFVCFSYHCLLFHTCSFPPESLSYYSSLFTFFIWCDSRLCSFLCVLFQSLRVLVVNLTQGHAAWYIKCRYWIANSWTAELMDRDSGRKKKTIK